MLGKSLPRRGFWDSNYTGRPGSGYGTNVQSGAVTQTLSASFTELVAALPHNIYWITITIAATATAATATDALLQLYIGDAGSEKHWIPDLLAGWSDTTSTGGTAPRVYQFPLYLPSGTRISAKSQALETSKTVRVRLEYSGAHNANGWYGMGVEALGTNISVSQGTSVTPGNASDGTWTDMGTSTFSYGYVLPMIHGSLTDVTMGSQFIHVDVGSGGASFPELEDFLVATTGSEYTDDCFGGLGRFTMIPANTAIQLRSQNSGANIDPFDYAVYGVY